MILKYRKEFNELFSFEKNKELVEQIERYSQVKSTFKISESPIFLTQNFKKKLINTSNAIINQIKHMPTEELNRAVPIEYYVPNDINHPQFMIFDYAICQNENLEIEPQLIELQAFPSLFGFMKIYEDCLISTYPFLNKLEKKTPKNEYIAKLKHLIIANEKVENVILLEVLPKRQKTYIDFEITKHFLGIETVCVTQIIKKGRKLFYRKKNELIPINRIYNRVVFDELFGAEKLELSFDFTENLEVEWVTHPNWFYKISKYLLPKLDYPYIPKSFYLNEFADFDNLDQYVLKPLFSFAGSGVNLNPKIHEIKSIENPQNYILQKKVQYASLFQDINNEFSKAEIRLMYIWDDKRRNPEMLVNMVRMTKSEWANMSNLNNEQIWVGCTTALFEK